MNDRPAPVEGVGGAFGIGASSMHVRVSSGRTIRDPLKEEIERGCCLGIHLEYEVGTTTTFLALKGYSHRICP